MEGVILKRYSVGLVRRFSYFPSHLESLRPIFQGVREPRPGTESSLIFGWPLNRFMYRSGGAEGIFSRRTYWRERSHSRDPIVWTGLDLTNQSHPPSLSCAQYSSILANHSTLSFRTPPPSPCARPPDLCDEGPLRTHMVNQPLNISAAFVINPGVTFAG
jgi:hypothetical protein